MPSNLTIQIKTKAKDCEFNCTNCADLGTAMIIIYGENGELLLTSEPYESKHAAQKLANKLVGPINWKIREA